MLEGNKLNMRKYKIVLTKKGESIFKGGNIEVMKPNLKEFWASSDKEAYRLFQKFIYSIGTAQEYFYNIENVQKHNKGGLNENNKQTK